MHYCLFFLFLLLMACGSSTESPNALNTDAIFQPAPKTDSISLGIPGLYEIADIDSRRGIWERIFVVIDTKKVHDSSVINKVVCEINKSPAVQRADISFFSDKKYAGYKDVLFFSKESMLPEDEYPDWRNKYYLGEFEKSTNTYTAFPAAVTNVNKKVYRLKPCENF